MEDQGIFYGVGVGPGDPELLTLKAVRVLEQVNAVFVPRAGQEKESLALSIAARFLRDEARVVELLFPMTRDREQLEASWDEAARQVRQLLDRGESAAFLTVGDPMLYSTYIYIFKRITAWGYPVETVPGIPSVCVAAAAAGFPLAEGDETMTLVPWNRNSRPDPGWLQSLNSLALLKVSSDVDGIIDSLKEAGFLQESVLVTRCGHQDERIETDLASLKGMPVNYFSLILARKEKL